MPFNGSGTYTPPAGQPVSSGTVIASSTFNTLVTDIANTFNNSLPRDGQAPMTAALKVVDGTVTIPGIGFNSEASTGLYRPATGMLALTVQGSEALRLVNGRLLIGTTTDDGTTKLQVGGNATVSGTLAVTGATTLSGAVTATMTGGSINSTPIGATTPSTGAFTTLAASGAATLNTFASSGATLTGGSINSTPIGATTPSTGAFTTLSATGASTLKAITATALVTTTNGNSLTTNMVSSAGYGGITINNESSARKLELLYLGSTGGAGYGAAAGSAVINAAGTTGLTISTNDNARMVFDGSGNVGIGRSASGYMLDVAGPLRLAPANTSGPQVGINLYDAGGGGGEGLYLRWESASRVDMADVYAVGDGGTGGDLIFATNPSNTGSASERMRIDSNGNLLVGTSTSAWNSSGRGVLEVNGSSSALVGLKVNGVQGGYLYHTGTDYNIVNNVAGNLSFGTNSTVYMRITTAGLITDAAGNELGYKGMPQTLQSSSYTLAAGDKGRHVYINAAASVTVPSSVFNVGDVITIVNGTGSPITLVQGTSAVLYQAGTTNSGNRSIAVHGICTLLCTAGGSFFVSGNIS